VLSTVSFLLLKHALVAAFSDASLTKWLRCSYLNL